jgi:hypothetical protein
MWMRSSLVVRAWLERLTAHAEVATVLGSIPASSDTVESEGRQMKQTVHRKKNQKITLLVLKGGGGVNVLPERWEGFVYFGKVT